MKKHRGLLYIVLVLVFGFPLGASAQGKRVIGYFVEWGVYGRNYHVADIPAERITHINYAFAKINSRGEVEPWDTYAALEKHYPATDSWEVQEIKGNFKQLRLLKERYPHLVVLVSVGGWTGSGMFSEIAASPEGRIRFAESARRFLDTYPMFDGVDIDWEFPVIDGLQPGRPADRENFSLLLAELRRALGPHRPLTIAVNAGPRGIQAIDYPSVVPFVDWINVMTYDFHGPWDTLTGHLAALYDNHDSVNSRYNLDAAVYGLIAAGVPAEKIVPGLPFYGRSFAGVQREGINQQFSGAGPGTFERGVLDYKDIAHNYEGVNGYVARWDDVAGVPYLYSAGRQKFITYDSVRSIRNKAAYVADRGLGGVFFWELSGDNGDLLSAIHEGFRDGGEVPACSDLLDNDGDGLIDMEDPGCESAADLDEQDPVVPDPLPDPEPVPDPGKTVTYELRIISDWGTGYCADVTVTNSGTECVAWEIAFSTEGTIGSLWSAAYAQVGGNVKARGLSWNSDLAPGASTTFGFCADRTAAPDPLPDPEPVPDPGKTVTYELRITSDWESGYCASVNVTNNGAREQDWQISVAVEGTVTCLWNARYTQEGNALFLEGLSWNDVLQTGQTLQVGFCAAR